MKTLISRRRRLLFYMFLFIAITFIAEGLGHCFLIFLDNSAITGSPSYKKIRLLLMNKATTDDFPYFLPQPNLNYINYPGLTKDKIQQNNLHGYRGNEVSVFKPKKSFRILFLGGSTTYGLYIGDFKKTYPFQTKLILDSLLKDDLLFHNLYDSIEVINAGLLGAISSEELSHYLFKYRYYSPDIVVIKSGLNEAEYKTGVFQPDYTHLRNIDFFIKPLPGRIRWIMHSKFASLIIINLFYIDYLNYGYILEKENYQYSNYCHWFPVINMDSLHKSANYTYTPFYQNISMLVHLIQQDSAIPVISTSPLNEKLISPDPTTWKAMLKNNVFNNSILSKIAINNNCDLVDLCYKDIDEKNWIDDCHVNEDGNRQIAKKTAAIIMDRIMFKQKYIVEP